MSHSWTRTALGVPSTDEIREICEPIVSQTLQAHFKQSPAQESEDYQQILKKSVTLAQVHAGAINYMNEKAALDGVTDAIGSWLSHTDQGTQDPTPAAEAIHSKIQQKIEKPAPSVSTPPR